MELKVALRGDLQAMLKDEERAIARAATRSVRAAAGQARRMLRSQIRRNFGERKSRLSGAAFEDTVRYRSKPKRGQALDAAATVYSRARYRRPGGEVDLLALYDQGVTIRARGGRWLAVPTSEAPLRSGEGSGRGGARRATPKESGLALQFIPIAKDRALLVTKGRRQRVLYVLLREVKLGKRLDVQRAYQSGERRLTSEFGRQLARQDQELEQRWS